MTEADWHKFFNDRPNSKRVSTDEAVMLAKLFANLEPLVANIPRGWSGFVPHGEPARA